MIGDAKGIVIRSHEHAPLQVDYGIGNFRLRALIHAPARHIRRIICRTQHAPLRAVPIAFGHLKEVDDLALVPNVIAGGDDIDIEFEQLFGERGRDAEAGGRVLAIGDDQVDHLIAHDARQFFFDDGAARPPKNVADEENSHALRW